MPKKAATIDETKKLREEIVASAKEKFGVGSATTEDNTCETDVTDWVSTGCPSLDWVCGKGFPLGKYVEIYGRESTGKSTMAYQAMAQIQKRGGIVIIIDTEGSYDSERARALGLKTNEIIFAQIETMEDIFDFIQTTLEKIRADNPDLPVGILWDSVAGTPIKAELEAEFGSALMMGAARVISGSLRKLRPAERKNTLIVFINQVRQKINKYGGVSWVTYGGEAIKFYASIRLELYFLEEIKGIVDGKEVTTGVKVKVTGKKNKVSPPFRTAEIVVDFGKGVDVVATELCSAVARKQITQAGAFFSLGDKKWRGYRAMEDYFREHPDEVPTMS